MLKWRCVRRSKSADNINHGVDDAKPHHLIDNRRGSSNFRREDAAQHQAESCGNGQLVSQKSCGNKPTLQRSCSFFSPKTRSRENVNDEKAKVEVRTTSVTTAATPVTMASMTSATNSAMTMIRTPSSTSTTTSVKCFSEDESSPGGLHLWNPAKTNNCLKPRLDSGDEIFTAKIRAAEDRKLLKSDGNRGEDEEGKEDDATGNVKGEDDLC